MNFQRQFRHPLLVLVSLLTTSVTLFGQAISGQIVSAQGEAMESVSVALNDDMNNASATFSDGSYRFWTLPTADNYVVKPFKTELNHLNGVSTYDLVLITRHILGTQPFANSFQMVAADTDASGTITTFDVIKLRKLILRIDENFTHTTPWRFVDANYTFPGTSPSSLPDFPQQRELNSEDPDANAVDFIGVKMGDVNGSAKVNNIITPDERNNEISVLHINPQLTGSEFVATFSTSDLSIYSAVQFTINFDPDQLAFRGIQALKMTGLTEDNLGLEQLTAGKITLSWHTTDALSFGKDDKLFALNFTALQRGNPAVTVTSDVTAALAYNREGLEIQLASQTAASDREIPVVVTPNPVANVATVSFNGQATSAVLSVYDLKGQLLKTYQHDATPGLNQIRLRRADFPTQGAVIYQLITGQQTVGGKLLLLD